jgi:hypothetical protein
MAIVIPDNISSKASQGERMLYYTLKDNLPDDYLVWYEPRVNTLYPDFIILSPTLGLLIIEVKGWYAANVTRANDHFFEITYRRNQKTRIESQQSPLRQSHHYFTEVQNTFKQYAVLTQSDGDYKGKLVFPTGYGAVMSNMTSAQAQQENIYDFLPQPQVAYREELLEWTEYSDRDLINRLKEMFKVRFSFPPLTDDQIETIRGILHSETKIKEVPATQESVPEGAELPSSSSIIKSLDFQQEQLARNLKGGHRLFCGVAGSGKTLILLSRAKYLSQTEPDAKILILCYNITLAAYLRSLLHNETQYQQIEVLNFHAWAKKVLGRLPNPQMIKKNYDEHLGTILIEHLSSLREEEKYDCVLVDEAHTFDPSWFKCCKSALKNPEDGDLLIVSDGSQRLYQRPQFSWKSVGIKAQGRTKKLKKNYRNTKEILTTAWTILDIAQEDSEIDATFPIVKPEAALRSGKLPCLQISDSPEREIEAAVQIVQSLQYQGYNSKEIAITYRDQTKADEKRFSQLISHLNQKGIEAYWVTKTDETKKQYNTQTPGVRILTDLSSLGLEFKVMIILWVQKYANACATDLDRACQERRQLYVAMTRAQEELYILGSGQTPLIQELSQKKQFELIRSVGA